MRGFAPLAFSTGTGLLTTAAGLVWRANTVALLGAILLAFAAILALRDLISPKAISIPIPASNANVPLDEKGRALAALDRAIVTARNARWGEAEQAAAMLDAALTATLLAFEMDGWNMRITSLNPRRDALKITAKYAEIIYPYLEQGQVDRAIEKGQGYLLSLAR